MQIAPSKNTRPRDCCVKGLFCPAKNERPHCRSPGGADPGNSAEGFRSPCESSISVPSNMTAACLHPYGDFRLLTSPGHLRVQVNVPDRIQEKPREHLCKEGSAQSRTASVFCCPDAGYGSMARADFILSRTDHWTEVSAKNQKGVRSRVSGVRCQGFQRRI